MQSAHRRARHVGHLLLTCPTKVAAAAIGLHVQGPVDANEGGSQHEDEHGGQHDEGGPGRSVAAKVPPEAVVAAQNDVELQYNDEQHKHNRHHLHPQACISAPGHWQAICHPERLICAALQSGHATHLRGHRGLTRLTREVAAD